MTLTFRLLTWRLSALLRSRAGIVALLLGAAMPLTFAPFHLWWLAPPLLVGLIWLWQAATPREAARIGLLFGIGQFLAGTYWLYISIHVFGQAPLLLALGLMLVVVLVMALYFALLGWLVARLVPDEGPVRWLLVLPGAWVLVEWLRGWLFTGFGWLGLGYAQTDSWLAGFAPLLGVYGVSLAVVLAAGALRCLAVHGGTRAAGALVLGGLAIAAALLVRIDWTEPRPAPVSVALLQGNVSQDIKWDPAFFNETLDLYERLTRESLGHDLIVWPEAAVPSLLHEVVGYLEEMRAVAEEVGSQLLLGILRYDFITRQYENTMVALTDAPQFYVKRHLVPFGEYFPVPAWVRSWMRLMNLPYTDIAAGGREQPALRVAGEVLAPSICYESLFGALQLDFYPEATLLVNISNDAWFGDSIAPHQHLQIARMRSIEARRYMLRSTNTGISAIIDPAGRVTARSPQFETHVLSGEVTGHDGLTPYARMGNVAVVLLALLMLGAGAFIGRRR